MAIQKISKQEIIAISIKLFRKQGYYRTSMADLAKETGLTKGVFYHHFVSKEELMQTALRTLNIWFEEKLFSIAYLPSLTAHEKLDKITEMSIKAFTKDAGGCFFANTVLETAHIEETFLPEIKLFFQNWEKAISKIFEGKYVHQVLADISQQIIADLEGALILMQLYKDISYLEKALERTKMRL
jgi:TetR/AcrR family transcriptional repressor of nem operon